MIKTNFRILIAAATFCTTFGGPVHSTGVPIINTYKIWASERITQEYGDDVEVVSYAFPCQIAYRRSGQGEIKTFRPPETYDLCADLDQRARDGYKELARSNDKLLPLHDLDELVKRLGALQEKNVD